MDIGVTFGENGSGAPAEALSASESRSLGSSTGPVSMAAVEEDWSAGRSEKDIQEEKAARERAREAFKGINALLKKCAEDEYFQDDLKQPTVIMALKHWTGEKRLPPEQATRLFAEDYRCRAVLEKLRLLQAECQKAGIAVPLDLLMRGEKELKLPGSGEKKASKASSKKEGEKKAEPAKKGEAAPATSAPPTSDAKPSARRRTTSKASGGGAAAQVVKQEEPPPSFRPVLMGLIACMIGTLIAWLLSPAPMKFD